MEIKRTSHIWRHLLRGWMDRAAWNHDVKCVESTRVIAAVTAEIAVVSRLTIVIVTASGANAEGRLKCTITFMA